MLKHSETVLTSTLFTLEGNNFILRNTSKRDIACGEEDLVVIVSFVRASGLAMKNNIFV